MVSEWRHATWSELATLEYGGLGTHDYGDTGAYRAYGTNGLVGRTDIAEVDGPGIIVGRKGAYRGIHYSPGAFGVIGTAFYLRPKIELDLKWAYYQLLTQDINAMDSGSAIPSTSRHDFYRLSLLLPPLSEQRAIASVLGALDDKIERNQKMCRTLDDMAQTLFKAWFVGFDIVKLSSEERASLDVQEVLGLFPRDLVETELGNIPDGWAIGTLGDILTLQRGFDLPVGERREGSYPVIASTGQIGVHSEYAVKGPGVVIGRSGSIGGGQWVGSDFWPLNTTLWVKDFRGNNPAYCYYLLRSIDFSRFNAGSSVPTLNRNHVSGLKIVIPPERLRREFSAFAGSCLGRMQSATSEVELLVQLRDALLPRLLRGELRVHDAEAIVEKAV